MRWPTLKSQSVVKQESGTYSYFVMDGHRCHPCCLSLLVFTGSCFYLACTCCWHTDFHPSPGFTWSLFRWKKPLKLTAAERPSYNQNFCFKLVHDCLWILGVMKTWQCWWVKHYFWTFTLRLFVLTQTHKWTLCKSRNCFKKKVFLITRQHFFLILVRNYFQNEWLKKWTYKMTCCHPSQVNILYTLSKPNEL